MLAVALAIAVAAPATAVALTPKTGVYHGVVDKTPYVQVGGERHNEGEGYIRLKKTSKGLRIVRPGSFTCDGGPCFVDNITAPGWWGKPYKACGSGQNATYPKNTKIPVKQSGSGAWHFSYTARSVETDRRIRFVGTWKAKGKIRGYTQFLMDNGCKSDKLPWTMNWIAK